MNNQIQQPDNNNNNNNNTITNQQQINKLEMEAKNTIINILKSSLNVLRDNEALTGPKALQVILWIVILKLIEPSLGGFLDIDNYAYDLSDLEYTPEEEREHKDKYLKLVRFSQLLKEIKNDDGTQTGSILKTMQNLWMDILSQHPSTKSIFTKNGLDVIKRSSTCIKLLNTLDKIPMADIDVLGDAYEEVVKDVMTGKTFGQFFTQSNVKNLMVKLIDPQLHPDGTMETCCDPAMGTGGFLMTTLKHILQQAAAKNIQPDWEFIKTNGLFGKELEPDTFRLAVSNMLISSGGHSFEQIECGDSIREPITRKFDNILANPPFGIKGLAYDDFQSPLKNEYTPIKTDNAVSLFIQAIIYMLKINGRCAVVLPDGQDLFSKTTATLVAVREYLMKTCDLKEIIYLPAGIFTYTSIKTCVFYFVKKTEGFDVIERIIKTTKKTKKNTAEYKFSNILQTTSVKFYNYNPNEDTKTLLVNVPIDEIVKNSYSLNYTEYIKVENEQQYEVGVVIKTIKEICGFLPKSKRQASYGNLGGLYPFYTSSQKCSKYCDVFDYDGESLIIGTGGNANIKYSNKFSCSTDNFIIKIKANMQILTKYIYYYLLNNIEVLQNGFMGVGLQHISKEYIEQIKIPIPPLTTQQKIVEYLDYIKTANKTSIEKIAQLKRINEFRLNHQTENGLNVVKTLGDVCNFQNGYSFKSSDYEKQNDTNIGILQIKSIQNGFIDENKITEYIQENQKYKLFEIQKDDILIALSGATTGKIGIYNLEHKTYLNQRVGKINAKPGIIQKYIYHWYVSCCVDVIVLNMAQGTAQPNISTNDISNIKIPVPPISKQLEIVAYCENNDNLIKQLKAEIETNKTQAREFIAGIVESSFAAEEHDAVGYDDVAAPPTKKIIKIIKKPIAATVSTDA